MKQSIKKKTPTKKAKEFEPAVFNGTLVGTWKNSNIYNVTFDSGALIVRFGSGEYKPDAKDMKVAERAWRDIAVKFGIDTRRVVVINV